MKIEKIKKMSNGKYQLILDNKEVITTYDEIIINKVIHKRSINFNARISFTCTGNRNAFHISHTCCSGSDKYNFI